MLTENGVRRKRDGPHSPCVDSPSPRCPCWWGCWRSCGSWRARGAARRRGPRGAARPPRATASAAAKAPRGTSGATSATWSGCTTPPGDDSPLQICRKSRHPFPLHVYPLYFTSILLLVITLREEISRQGTPLSSCSPYWCESITLCCVGGIQNTYQSRHCSIVVRAVWNGLWPLFRHHVVATISRLHPTHEFLFSCEEKEENGKTANTKVYQEVW